jgi:hypothetical protein
MAPHAYSGLRLAVPLAMTVVGPKNPNQLKGVTFVPVMSPLAEPIFP